MQIQCFLWFLIWIFCTGFSNYDTVDMLVNMSSRRNFQRLSWAYAASNNTPLYYLISCLKGFILYSKILCRYHAARKIKLNFVCLLTIKWIRTIPFSIYPLRVDSTQNTIWVESTHNTIWVDSTQNTIWVDSTQNTIWVDSTHNTIWVDRTQFE